MAETKATSWAKDFLDDVKERQVNTIIAEGISGRTMTSAVSGLVEIANAYLGKLREAVKLDPTTIPQSARSGADSGSAVVMKGNDAAFQFLSASAARALAAADSANPHRVLLRRIEATSRELGAIAERNQTSTLSPRDRAVILKAWELGTSTVAMQTTIGLDGDLVTRIARAHTGPKSATVRDIHAEAVRTSIGTWEALLKGVLQLARPGRR